MPASLGAAKCLALHSLAPSEVRSRQASIATEARSHPSSSVGLMPRVGGAQAALTVPAGLVKETRLDFAFLSKPAVCLLWVSLPTQDLVFGMDLFSPFLSSLVSSFISSSFILGDM